MIYSSFFMRQLWPRDFLTVNNKQKEQYFYNLAEAPMYERYNIKNLRPEAVMYKLPDSYQFKLKEHLHNLNENTDQENYWCLLFRCTRCHRLSMNWTHVSKYHWWSKFHSKIIFLLYLISRVIKRLYTNLQRFSKNLTN